MLLNTSDSLVIQDFSIGITQWIRHRFKHLAGQALSAELFPKDWIPREILECDNLCQLFKRGRRIAESEQDA